MTPLRYFVFFSCLGLPLWVFSPVADAERSAEQPSLIRQYERDLANNPIAISTYRRNYILPIAYDSNLPRTSDFNQIVNGPPDHTELKYQLSLKVALFDDLFGDNGDLFLGYTQYSLWQAYNERSAPFRETNYEPEIFLRFDNSYEIGGWTNTFNRVGLIHQSNGRPGRLSRSWNRIYYDAVFARGPWTVSIMPWWRLPETDGKDDNPDIQKYLGYADVTAVYSAGNGQEISLLTRGNPIEERYGHQLDYAFPLFGRVRGYIQYYNGYGETLIDYNRRVNRIGIGFSFNPLVPGAPGGMESFETQPRTMTLSEYLEQLSETNPLALSAYHRNYVLPSSINRRDLSSQHFDQLGTGASADDVEFKFQLSLKTYLWSEPFGLPGNLYAAYTQTSWWQAYNGPASSLFRETNYEPTLFMSFPSERRILGWQNVDNSVGFVHQSNGRANSLSRSWNRIYAESTFQNGNWHVRVRPWWRIPEDRASDDNPDIDHYMGYGDVTFGYTHGNQEVTWQVRGNPLQNTYGHQLEYAFPLWSKVHGFVQIYDGYGESMIDYNQKVSRIGFGLSFNNDFLSGS